MLSPTDNSYSSPLPKPAAGGLLDDPSGTASAQPIAKPQPLPSTQPLALAPDAPMPAPTSAPADATAPNAPAPVTPPPLATPDPLAFAPQTPTPVPVAASTVSPAPLTPSAPTPVPSDTTPTMSGGTLNPTPAIPTDPNGMPTSGGGAPPGAGQAQIPAGDPSTSSNLGGGPFPDNGMIAAEGQGEGAPQGNVGGGGNGLAVPAPLQAPLPVPTDANGMPSYSTTPTTPDNSLINSTITPGPATDRYAIAQKEYDDWVAQSDPQFQAQMRDANRYSAAAGRIGSGQATNSIGDIQTQRENATRSARDSFLGNALTGSIDDAYKNIGVAQQQQGFQAGQQQTAFGQNVELQQLANSEQGQQYAQMMQSLGFNAQQIQQAFQNAYSVQQLSNSQDAQSFYQALEQELQGSQGDPAQILAWISGQYARGGA